MKKQLPLNETEKDAIDLCKKMHGNVTRTYLMRKLKMSYIRAQFLIEWYEELYG